MLSYPDFVLAEITEYASKGLSIARIALLIREDPATLLFEIEEEDDSPAAEAYIEGVRVYQENLYNNDED